MKFEIIKNSQSNTGYDIPDDIFYGQIPGLLMGWQFEVRNVSDKRYPIGKVDYYSVTYDYAMPEQYVVNDYYVEYVEGNGWELTGRVIFRGYAHEHYDIEERDFFVTDATEEEVQNALREMKAV